MRTLRIVRGTLPLLAVMLAAGTPWVASAAPSKIVVPTDHPTVQAAIDAASPGDSIRILPGTYTEQLTIDKDLQIIGAGAAKTRINAPAVLSPRRVNPRPGRAVIVEVFNSASVRMEKLAVTGPAGTTCSTEAPPGGLAGFSVTQGASLVLDDAGISGCTREALLVGFASFIPGGPEVGHVAISRTAIADYRVVGIQAGGPGTSVTLSYSTLVGGVDPEFVGQIGVFFSDGATARIDHTRVSGNLCHDPACGPDFFNEVQAGGIVAIDAGVGSLISHNEVSGNDTGIVVAGSSGCCSISHNALSENRFFGLILVDGDHTSSHDRISGGNVGVAVVGISVDTTGTLVHERIVDTVTPVEEMACCGATAEAILIH